MGRHSDPDPRWFWQSLAVAVGKAAAVLVLLGAAVFVAARLMPDSGTPDAADAADAATEPAVPAPGPGQAPEQASGQASGQAADEDETFAADYDADLDSAAEDDAGSIGADVAADDDHGGDDAAVRATVQVLNASGDASLLDEVSDLLESLGYAVVARGPAARRYERTTLLWSTGFETQAEALRRDDARFAVVQANDRLDKSIDLHVIIGADWTQDE